MKRSVLIIDDENDLCELVKRALNREGFVVDCAHSLAEASKKLPRHPNIVILDNNLPDGNGLAYFQMHTIDFIKSHVIMISADSSKELQTKAAGEGIMYFLPKPFSMARMKEIIRATI